VIGILLQTLGLVAKLSKHAQEKAYNTALFATTSPKTDLRSSVGAGPFASREPGHRSATSPGLAGKIVRIFDRVFNYIQVSCIHPGSFGSLGVNNNNIKKKNIDSVDFHLGVCLPAFIYLFIFFYLFLFIFIFYFFKLKNCVLIAVSMLIATAINSSTSPLQEFIFWVKR